jgi:hypothetical protein
MENLSTKDSILLTTAVMVSGFIFLYLNLFYFPNIPIHLYGDKSTYLFNAQRMLDGQLVYRDFFQHPLPATEIFYLLLFSLLGVHSWIPNATLILLGLSLAWFIIVISKKIIPGRTAFLPAVLFLVLAFYSQPGAASDWFSILWVLAAVAVLIDRITALGLVAAGVLCGLATCFSQSRGVSAEIGLAAFLVWAAYSKALSWDDCRKAQTYLWVPFVTVVVAFNAYFALEAGIGRFLYETVAFGFRYWPTATWNSHYAYMTDLPQFHPGFRLPGLIVALAVYLLVPLVYLLFFVRRWDEEKDLPSEPWDRLMVLWFVGLALFLGVVTAPTWVRLCTVSAPAFILFVWYFNFEGLLRKVRIAALWVLALVLAVGVTTESKLQWRGYATTPIGKVAILNHSQYDEIKFLLGNTKPGEYIFGNCMLGYLLDLRAPARVAYVTASDYTRPEQVINVIEGLKTHPAKYVFWSPVLDLPQASPSSPSHLAPLYAYLRSHYHIAKIFPNYDMFWGEGAQPPSAAVIQTGSETPGASQPPVSAPIPVP